MDTKPFVPLAQRGPDVKAHISLMDIGEAAIRIQDLLFESMGELIPETEAALDALLAEGAERLDSAAWVVRKLAGDAETCKAEATRFTARQKAYEAQAEALKARMLFAVDAAFGGKLRTAHNTIWGQTSGEVTRIEVAPDADLDKMWWTDSALLRRKLELNKEEIKHRFDAGDPIPASISVEVLPGKRSLRIR